MDPGDEVLYPSPGFPIYESQIEFLGGVAKPYGFVPGEKNFLLDFDAIEAADHPADQAAHLQQPPQPHRRGEPRRGDRGARRAGAAGTTCTCSRTRPTGTCATRDGAGRSRPCRAWPERTVILYTFSKKFAMTGWRLGGAIGPEELIAHIATLNVNQESCTTHFIQWAGVEALTGDQSGAEEIIRVLQERRDVGGRPPERRSRASAATVRRRPSTCSPTSPELMERKGLETYDQLRRAALEQTGVSFCTRLHFGRALPGEAATLRALRLLRHQRRAHPRRARPAQGVGAVSGDAGTAAPLLRTPFHAQHVAAGAKMVDFGGWEMPVQYPTGIIAEHLATRRGAGLFDVSHMGRFVLRGPGSAAFLQHVLTNNAEALDLLRRSTRWCPPRPAAPSTTPTSTASSTASTCSSSTPPTGTRTGTTSATHLAHFPDVELERRDRRDRHGGPAGPASRDILGGLIESGGLPEPLRNELSVATLRLPGDGASWRHASPAPATPASPSLRALRRRRTTGRPSGTRWSPRAPCPPASAPATPCGSRPACRSTATSWASTRTASEIPIFGCPLATFAVSFSPLKGDFIGRAGAGAPARAYARILQRDYSLLADLPRLTRPVAVTGRGIAREGAPVYAERRRPLRRRDPARLGDQRHRRPLLGSRGRRPVLAPDRRARAALHRARLRRQRRPRRRRGRGRRPRPARPRARRPYHLRSDAPPYARAIVWDYVPPAHRARGRRGAARRRCACSARRSPTTSGASRSASTSSPPR